MQEWGSDELDEKNIEVLEIELERVDEIAALVLWQQFDDEEDEVDADLEQLDEVEGEDEVQIVDVFPMEVQGVFDERIDEIDYSLYEDDEVDIVVLEVQVIVHQHIVDEVGDVDIVPIFLEHHNDMRLDEEEDDFIREDVEDVEDEEIEGAVVIAIMFVDVLRLHIEVEDEALQIEGILLEIDVNEQLW